LEEDTGKLKHSNLNGKNVSLVDFNRSGVPLVEIVTEPEIHSSSQAKEFGQKLQQIIRQLGVSDCDMEKGSMRLEANISWGMDLNYKVEVKNVNSFKFIAKAIDYELKRQKEILDNGVTPEQETRGWDEQGNKTKSQRSKETAADYRYFPEPDIPPMSLTDEEIETLRGQLPELPEEMIVRWVKTYGLREDYAGVLMADGLVADYADQVFELANEAKADINKLAGEIVNKRVDVSKVGPSELIEKHKHDQNEFVSDENELELWTREAMLALPDAVKDYQGGKQVAIGVLVGKVMQLSKGKANPGKVKEMLEKNLEE
jgi:aspartyl-tRNA(Asn)/glutamyl-tRNA(Gln) amidotransferase subunit B